MMIVLMKLMVLMMLIMLVMIVLIKLMVLMMLLVLIMIALMKLMVIKVGHKSRWPLTTDQAAAALQHTPQLQHTLLAKFYLQHSLSCTLQCIAIIVER